jgi:hypothetical protein
MLFINKIMNKLFLNKTQSIIFACCLLCTGSVYAQISKYNIEWKTPGKDATSSMPVGNGDLGANVYTVQDGDLYLLLSKKDAFDWNGNVLKTGRIRIRINPNPFFHLLNVSQVLNLEQGCIDIQSVGRKTMTDVSIRVWVDANAPVYHVDINATRDIDIKIEPEFWERQDGSYDRLETIDHQLMWYYSNGKRSVYADDLAYYEIEAMRDKHPDPYQYNTFGCLLQVQGLSPENNAFQGYGKSFAIEIASLAEQVKEVDIWKKDIRRLLTPDNRTTAWTKHCEWWKAFWDRSWITASDNTLPAEDREKAVEPKEPGKRAEKDGGFIVAQSYNVHRFVMACQGRGRYQTQFNGGIFTMPFPNYRTNDGSLIKEDERDWGNRFTFQNQRLLYWPMLAAGDYDLMLPFFKYYFSILDLRKAITRQWFGHDGAYYRENIQLTGAEIDDSPHSRNKPPKTDKNKPLPPGGYHNYHFNSGLELAVMALDYARYSNNRSFMTDTVVPLSREVIRFFANHYESDKNGKLLLYPSQVLETWWDATNPTTDVAGLRYLIAELLQQKNLPSQDRKEWEKLQKQLPEVALGTENGKQFILPAAKYAQKSNAENGELYAVFPYPLFGVGHNTENIVSETMLRRTAKNAFDYRCWTQDQIQYACAGMAEEAKDGLIHRWSQYSKRLRFPVFGTESPDYVPDFDHNGSGSVALQKMIVQEVGDKIYLLPAWPKEWDTSFKLHLRNQTVIEGVVKNGKLERFIVTPESRRKDVIFGNHIGMKNK